jgi:hypothetical protein
MTVTIEITKAIGVGDCTRGDDGERMAKVIMSLFDHYDIVMLSFNGVRTVLSSFLNPLISTLLGAHGDATLAQRLIPIGLTPHKRKTWENAWTNCCERKTNQ